METKDILLEAKGAIAQGWCQKAIARTECGIPTTVDSRRAVEWCAVGAIRKTVRHFGEHRRVRLELDSMGALGEIVGDNISRWNDEPGRTQDEVVAVFNKAIERCEA